MKSITENFVSAIGYPEDEVLREGDGLSLVVDDREIRLRERNSMIVLEHRLGSESVEKLAEYAAGRLMKEEAYLAFDGESGEAVLREELPGNALPTTMRKVFELFTASVDWWSARAAELKSQERIPEMMIRP